MDWPTCYCMNPECAWYGKTGSAGQLKLYDWQRASPRFRCMQCRRVFAASTGPADAGVRSDLSTERRGAQTLADGVSLRATGRLIETDTDPVQPWRPILRQHCGNLMNYFFRHVHLSACQWDELWTFIYQKEAPLTAVEQLQEI